MRAFVAAGIVALLWGSVRAEEAPPAKTEAKTGETKTDAAEAPKAENLVEQPAELSKALAEGVKMLEEKKYKDFLDRFLHPDDKKKIQTEWDKVVAGFEKKKAAELLETMKQIVKDKVELSEDGKIATFHVKPMAEAHRNTIRFGKSENVWYLYNN